MEESSPIDVLDKVYPRPVLFIHSKDDPFISEKESLRMARAHPKVFQTWIESGVGHAHIYQHFPDEYIKRVDAFSARRYSARPENDTAYVV